MATKLTKESGEVQVSSLIYAMGSEAENIFKSFNFADGADEKKFDVVLKKYDEYFYPKRNVIHERACFHQRVQRPGEKAEMFIRALYEMSEHCEFGVNRDEHIRDRIVVGIVDKELSRKLQLMAELTLAQTVQNVRQSEEVTLQVHQQGEAHAAVQEVRGNAAGRGKSKWQPKRRESGEQGDSKCGKCGKLKHTDPARCPAMNSTCNRCKKVGHWENKCYSKLVREVTEETVSQRPYYLGAVTNTNRNDELWTIKLTIGAAPVKFKIDTGADANIMGEETFNKLTPKKKLEPSNITLCSPGGQLDCLGKFLASTQYKGKPYTFPVYVISGKTANNLLSRDTATSMGLVKRIEEVHKAFGELGTLKTEPVKILLKENAQPYTVHTARRVPLPMLQQVKEELQRMEENEVIEAVTEPTDWCAPMVPVPRKNGKVRICVDLKRLNEGVRRERYVLPTAEEITAKLSGATMFTSLDAASGFWQIPLHPESTKLTTFITPFGRYAFKRLPFGITSAPEIFQRKMTETLNGLEGVAIFMDDVLVYGDTPEQHDQRLSKVLERIESAGLKLNKEKCKFRQDQLHFLGQVIDKSGVRPDPDKVKAIRELPPPQNVNDLRRVLGMFNYLGKYIPNLSTVGQPLYELLRSKSVWTWDHSQQEAFQRLKDILSTSPVLKFYDVNRPTAVSADASSYGIGGVLLQLHDKDWKPVAFCSRRLSEAETRYAQIEKECLASVWACERFEKYLCGLENFKLVTDHKPLVPLMNKKDLDNVPIRCQRLLMRLMRFKPTAEYAPGKTLTVADTLSRSPLQYVEREADTHSDVACYIAAIVDNMPATPHKLMAIKTATAADYNLQLVLQYVRSGWPEYIGNVPAVIKDYFPIRNELSEHNGIIIRGNRMVIPDVMRADILDRIHDGHQGLTKCRERAHASVWWPGVSSEIKNKVQSCQVCREMKPAQRKEPLISTPLPDRPWKRLAIDLCDHNKHIYLVVSDYFSRFLEILHLPTTTASQVILKLKGVFGRFGCPDEVVSDNGPQFSCQEFQEFARQFDFMHITSSPHNPQGNGHAERGVQTAKRILQQKDPLLALMCYRSTPCATTGVSPAELLMGRKIKTTLPTLEANLQPRWPDLELVRNKDAMEKQKQAFYFNQRHGARPLPSLKPGDPVLMKLDHQKSWKTPAIVTGEGITPRSFVIETPQGATLRRNRRHLQHVPETAGAAHPLAPDGLQQGAAGQQPDPPVTTDTTSPTASVKPPDPQNGLFHTRSGRQSKPGERLNL